jgi:hypothetical protein
MRASLTLLLTVTVTALGGYIGGCGGTSTETTGFDAGDGGRGPDATHFSEAGKLPTRDGGKTHTGDGSTGDAPGGEAAVTLSHLVMVPANDSITVKGGAQGTVKYKVMGELDGQTPAVDVTDRFVFWAPGTVGGKPNNYLIGGFPSNGDPTFKTRLPTLPTDPPQQGGTLTVEAIGLNPGGDSGVPISVSTTLTVKLTAEITGPVTPADTPDGGAIPDAGAIPANAGSLFGGPANTAYAPTIAYPNDGVMLPPNLKFLEVHWVPQPGTSVYKVSFDSAAATITYIVGCGTVPNGPFPSTACALVLDTTGYGYLAASNSGGAPVTVTVAATDATGTGVGTSAPLTIQFAQEAVNGGVYYWNVSQTEIMRFDFGGTGTTPEVFLAPGDYGLPGGQCVGCHAISAPTRATSRSPVTRTTTSSSPRSTRRATSSSRSTGTATRQGRRPSRRTPTSTTSGCTTATRGRSSRATPSGTSRTTRAGPRTGR